MKSGSELKNRIIYEALSRLSTALSQCQDFEDIQICLKKNLKYLLDFEGIRLVYYNKSFNVSYNISADNSYFEKGQRLLLTHEEMLLNLETPVIIEDDQHSLIPQMPVEGTVWGWNFRCGENEGIIISIFSGKEKTLQKTVIPILKIAAENLYAKINTLLLIKELDNSKKNLQIALQKVEEQNVIISDLLTKQDEIIKTRTQQLKDKNEKMLQLSKVSAHAVREPLTRILGLIQITDLFTDQEFRTTFIPMLKNSSRDLDIAVKHEIQIIDEELKNLKLYENNVGG